MTWGSAHSCVRPDFALHHSRYTSTSNLLMGAEKVMHAGWGAPSVSAEVRQRCGCGRHVHRPAAAALGARACQVAWARLLWERRSVPPCHLALWARVAGRGCQGASCVQGRAGPRAAPDAQHERARGRAVARRAPGQERGARGRVQPQPVCGRGRRVSAAARFKERNTCREASHMRGVVSC